jgi:hypothetical protein
MDEASIALIKLLITRLERISVDSFWAHQASGVRGSLLKVLEDIECNRSTRNPDTDFLLNLGFEILEHAAEKMNC